MVLKANYTWSNKVHSGSIVLRLQHIFSGISIDRNPAPVVGYPFVVEQFSILNVTYSWHYEVFLAIFVSDQAGNEISTENNYSDISKYE
jgi:hypothetical protein